MILGMSSLVVYGAVALLIAGGCQVYRGYKKSDSSWDTGTPIELLALFWPVVVTAGTVWAVAVFLCWPFVKLADVLTQAGQMIATRRRRVVAADSQPPLGPHRTPGLVAKQTQVPLTAEDIGENGSFWRSTKDKSVVVFARRRGEMLMVWRPAIVPTVGVQFLPGFKNENKQEDALKLQWWRCQNGYLIRGNILDTDALLKRYTRIAVTDHGSEGPQGVCTKCGRLAGEHFDAVMPIARGCNKYISEIESVDKDKIPPGHPSDTCTFCCLPKGWHR